MINNRQNGRRRGRGGTRPPNGSNNGPERGNRLDNRARGNANQLHEKYKTLARDAQMQGDRVMTEYYLQFADHYFRVLSETRSRFEEQRRFRDDNSPEFDEDEGDGDLNGAYDDRVDDGQDYRQQPQRQNEGGRQQEGGRQNEARQNDRQGEGRQNEGRQNEGRQDARRERGNDRPRRDRQPEARQQNGYQAEARQPERRRPEEEHERQIDVRPADAPASEPDFVDRSGGDAAPVPVAEAGAAERPRRTRARREAPVVEASPERIEIDRLPPSFALTAEAEPAPEVAPDGEEAPRRRRVRRPRTDVAPVEA